MTRLSLDVRDDYLQPHCTVVMRHDDKGPDFLLELYAFEYQKGEEGRLRFTKSPGELVGSLVISDEQAAIIAAIICEARGWTVTSQWMKGKSLPADEEPEDLG